MTPDDLGYLDAEVDSRIAAEKERRFPESTCTHCRSYLLCLTSRDDYDKEFGIITRRFLKKCVICKKRVLFYPVSRVDRVGGYVLRGCLLPQDDNDYECPECEEERTSRACTDLLEEWEEEDS